MNISLLPPEIKAQEATRQKVEKIIFVGIVVAIVCLAILVLLVFLNISQKLWISSVQNEQKQIENEIKTRYQMWADLEGQIEAADSTLLTALGTNPDWYLVLTEIENTKPKNITLVSIESASQMVPGAVPSNNILVRGNAPDLPSLVAWFEVLKENDLLTNARFKYTAANDILFGSAYIFQIEMKLRPGKGYTPKWEGGV